MAISRCTLWRTGHVTTLALAITGSCASAAAQERATQPAPARNAATGAADIEEVVVTARRRAENLQSTPVAITAISSREIEARGLARVTEVTQFAPNVTFEGGAPLSGSSAAAFVFIRGVGQTDFNQQTEPGVGVYLDQVYLGRSVGQVMSTLDLEQIEVLRGPQGTLFGRNTIGGAISLTTRKPDHVLAGYAEGVVGRYDRADLKGAINIPLTDELFVRINAARIRREGHVIREPDGFDLGEEDKLIGRIAMRWRPLDRLTIDLALDADRERENGAAASLVAVNTQPVTGQPAGNPPNFPAIGNCLAQGLPPASPPCANFGGVVGDRRFYNSQWLPPSPFVSYGAGPFADGGDFRSDLDMWGANLTIALQLPFGELKSITAYRDLESYFARDDDHSPVLVTSTSNDYRQDQFSQELQLTGDVLDDRLAFTLGAYHFQERGRDVNLVLTPISLFQSGGGVHNRSQAVFGQGAYRLTEALTITGGLRYTDETKRYTPDQRYLTNLAGLPGLNAAGEFGVGPGFDRIQPAQERRKRFREWTPHFNVAYQVRRDVLAYATYSEGYKSGGFTQRIFPAQVLVPDFDPEFVKVVELGLKSQLFDRRLRLNAAAFHTEYDDMQVMVQEGFAPQTRNAAKARIRGFELEGIAAPAENLMLAFSVGYTDAGYRALGPTVAGLTLDSALPYTPEWTLSGSAAYTFASAWGEVTPRLDWSYRDDAYTDALNTAEIRQEGHHVLNASLSWRPDAGGVRVTGGVTNLTDERYFRSASADLAVKGSAEASWARPREWFLAVRYSF